MLTPLSTYGLSPAQRTKTLAHELAHVLLHPDTAKYFQSRDRCEVEAESMAYLVCQAAGLATDGYSWPYIAHWSTGKVEIVQEAAGRVIETARAVLTPLSTSDIVHA